MVVGWQLPWRKLVALFKRWLFTESLEGALKHLYTHTRLVMSRDTSTHTHSQIKVNMFVKKLFLVDLAHRWSKLTIYPLAPFYTTLHYTMRFLPFKDETWYSMIFIKRHDPVVTTFVPGTSLSLSSRCLGKVSPTNKRRYRANEGTKVQNTRRWISPCTYKKNLPYLQS